MTPALNNIVSLVQSITKEPPVPRQERKPPLNVRTQNHLNLRWYQSDIAVPVRTARQSQSVIDQGALVMIVQQIIIQRRNILVTNMTSMMRFHQTPAFFHLVLLNLQLFLEGNPDHQLIMDTRQSIRKVEITGHSNLERGHQVLIMVIGEGFGHQVQNGFHGARHHKVPLGVTLTDVKAGTRLFNVVEIDHPVQEGDHPVQEGDHPVQEGDRPVQEGDRPVLKEGHKVLEGDPLVLEEVNQLVANLKKVD